MSGNKDVKKSSHGGLDRLVRYSRIQLKSTFWRSVDRIPLGETTPAISMFYVYMVPTPTDVCYKYK